MKRTVAVILISLLVAPPASAGQKPGKPIRWEKAQQLRAGTEVMLTVTGGQPTKVRLLFADDSILVTFKPDAPKLPGKVESALVSIGSGWPAVLDRRASFEDHSIRVSPEGVFDGAQKVADLGDVIQQTRRGDVVGISEPPHSNLTLYVVIASAIAAVVFWILLAAYAE